jgi:hypothetical protein
MMECYNRSDDPVNMAVLSRRGTFCKFLNVLFIFEIPLDHFSNEAGRFYTNFKSQQRTVSFSATNALSAWFSRKRR